MRYLTIVYYAIVIVAFGSIVCNAEVLFTDDFSGGHYDGWEVMFGGWSASNQRLEHASSAPLVHHARISSHHQDPLWHDYRLTLRIYPDPQGDYDGDIFFYVEEEVPSLAWPQKCYAVFFRNRGDGHGLWLARIYGHNSYVLDGGTWLTDAAPYYDVEVSILSSGTGNSIQVEFAGFTMSCYDETSQRPNYGGLSLRSYVDAEGMSYDDILVEGGLTVSSETASWGAVKALFR